MKKSKLALFSISAVLLTGAGTTFAAQTTQKPVKSVQKIEVEATNDVTQKTVKQKVMTHSPIVKEDSLVKTGGSYGAYFDAKEVLSLLSISVDELQKELDNGKSIVDVAISKNISKQALLEAIVKEQIKVQQEYSKNEQAIQDISKKFEALIESK